jgi:23S rRNA pseudouridine1911/1915/1917 synthase
VAFEDTDAQHLADHANDPAPEVTVIDQAPDYLVVDKPVGILVHPDAKTHTGTMVDAILAIDPAIGKTGEDPERPGIVHRLDKDVSGLMVVARTQKGFEHLKHQFSQHQTEKTYIALVYGEVPQDEGDLKFRIARSKTKGRMAARPEHELEGKAAWTHYKVVTRYRHATLLELQIISGRTHQIRAHMLAFNHPIVGDPLYTRAALERNVKAPRIMLQCVKLAFDDPSTGERKRYELAPVPEFAQLSKIFS